MGSVGKLADADGRPVPSGQADGFPLLLDPDVSTK